ncbi:alcohol dehydrogenase catalytic domain-containing protein [Pseudonocardia abyssalis]|uniref:Alcohol dehydrogenase catalytic domain-containing protein n=1 Tax=Pseudonocardia abyssalis TaxID=2792008 RepID=A0ABS6UR54_9PSEU|nr:alcohol dehydrogenase catalytic domain-containing protein [Pseudonocardia abyssalis]MBW0115947.1 alcohol dehydrogenase catalytic domain-containing protein [Pseudonocardia abyssalis]MBW0134724.1 alcohol dehydrogenase catalytic domain-containing protein [Pseudonocardia abyssalis]
MRAVVFGGDGRVSVESVTDAAVADPTDAVVRVRRAAVCGTDLHIVSHAEHVPRGTVLGHEFAGEVVEVGPAVVGHRVGDRVVGADFTACGTCWWCRRGDHWECGQRRFFGTGAAFGPALAGSQAELVRVPFADTVLCAVPDDVALDAAVFLGDTLATGYAAVQRCGLRPGDTVAVLGGGPVGQLTSLAAQACGAGVVVVSEPVEQRRALAAGEGALGTDPDGARALVDEVTDGRGADAVIDAIGGPRGLESAFGLVRRRGTIVSVGVHADPTWPLPVARAFADELTLRFAIGDLMRDGDALLALVRSGAVDPTVVASETVDIDGVPDAYRRMAQRRTLKSLIAF